MPQMQYKAMDENGRTSAGVVEAANAADLEMRLSRMGLDLINFKERSAKRSGGTIPRREMMGFTFHLEQLITAGVPLVDGLVDLRDSTESARMREVMAGMVESIEGGKTLSGAMEEHPQVFDDVFVNLVKAGEFSGQVGEVLRSITENLKWQDEQAEQIKKLLMYPSIVGVVVTGVVFFLMSYLVPQLVAFIENMGETLPMHTQVLIMVSDVFVNYWYLVLITPVLGFISLLTLIRLSPSVAYTVDALKLRVWVIGPLMKKIILARFANYFALMYASGITVLECIRVIEGLVGNRAIQEATRRAGRHISDGASISAGFEYAGLFPPLVLRMLRVGENTGALDVALKNISYFYERDVRDSMARMQTLIGPAMTVVVGAVLFWVIISVLGPIYDLITKMKF